MNYNIALKAAVVKSQQRQFQVAEKAGIRNDIFSQILWGRVVPSKDEKKAIAKALRTTVEEIFPSLPDEATA